MTDNFFQPKQIKVKKGRFHYSSGTRFIIKSATMLQNRMNSVLDPEREWHSFHATISNGNPTGRFYRVNPAIGVEPPSLDDTEKVTDLQRRVRHSLQFSTTEATIGEIAQRLVATSFYFDIEHMHAGSLLCDGK